MNRAWHQGSLPIARRERMLLLVTVSLRVATSRSGERAEPLSHVPGSGGLARSEASAVSIAAGLTSTFLAADPAAGPTTP